MSKLLRTYKITLQKYPVIVQSLQVGLLLGTGDAIAQKCIEQRFDPKPFDFARNRNFILIGTFVIGPCTSTWFSILDRFIRGNPAQKALKKVICDQFIFAPCFLATFLMMLETMERRSLTEAKKADLEVFTMENYLLDENNWRLEAESVIGDIKNHVRRVNISGTLQSSNNRIFLNMQTLENQTLCIELSANGFRIVGNVFDHNDVDDSDYYETPYSLLNKISPMFSASFRDELFEKLGRS